jgi:hypothetical protein
VESKETTRRAWINIPALTGMFCSGVWLGLHGLITHENFGSNQVLHHKAFSPASAGKSYEVKYERDNSNIGADALFRSVLTC